MRRTISKVIFATSVLLATHQDACFAQSDKYVHITTFQMGNLSHYTYTANLLTEKESVGNINKSQFEKRFKKEKGLSNIMAYMDSLGYEPLYMGSESTTNFSFIYKKK